MKVVRWTLLGLLLFLVALIWQVPASAVLARVQLPPQVQLSGVEGSLWQGSVAKLQLGDIAFDQLQWQAHPWQLLTGKLGVSLHSRPGATRLAASLTLGLGGKLAVENLVMKAPVAPLVANVRLPVPSQVSGELSLAIPEFRLGKPWCEALAGKAQWLDAGVTNRFGDFDLGRIDADLGCDKGALTAVVRDTPPRLGLELEARVDASHYQVRGFAKPAADQPKSLQDAFAFFGKAGSDGRYPVQFKGPIPR
ncbi:type II secretion system protein N [Gallaecimonas kandeliae]|uniref:type II secretion system protein N n=1 Tax=Gallaecimonas kandeliae TaxID=3029055 RepID=UPI0026472A42|nr:type II secretion system protein N [Gallaecimonas kandeliae]WKE65924.1 type II secretion system protein N [Gallaecimonas kandeliae]